MLIKEENNPEIGAGLGTLLPVQNSTAPICGTFPELHQHCNPDLTYHPNTTPLHQPQNPNNQATGSLCKVFPKTLFPPLVLVGAAS
jgi:hypothetical protein